MAHELDPDWPVFFLTPEEDGDLDTYEFLYDGGEKTDNSGRTYETVGEFMEDTDWYQGMNMITVVRRKSDGKAFGFSWWQGGGKYGEPYLEDNGYDYDLEPDNADDLGDWQYLVFKPVEKWTYESYRTT
jgi:hypothetical protein